MRTVSHEQKNEKLHYDKITAQTSATSSSLNTPVTSISSGSATTTFNLDIANFLKESNISITDYDRAVLIKSSNIPDIDFVYQFSIHSKKDKEEKSDKGGRYKTIQLFKFVSKPLQKYAKLLGKDGDLEVHIADNFMTTFNNPKKEVINLINTERKKQSIIFSGRQNIPFRGHRDHGNFFENDLEKNSIVNKVNFCELLYYRINFGDSILENPVVHKELIDCCRTIVTEIILKEIKESKFYSVIFDETTDITVVKENFIALIDCHAYVYNTDTEKNFEPKLNGEVLGDVVISLLQKFDLDLKYYVGIGTDGCSVMVSLLTAICTPMSCILQGIKINNDVLCVKNCIDDVISNLENKRNNCQSIFEEIFKECEELMIELDIDVKVPRLPKKQINRANYLAKTTEEYYPVSVYIPLLDSIIEDLKSRFLSKENKLSKTWLRSKMSQDRLTGLALLNIHRSIEINVDDVIDRFTSLKKRNIDFVL
ncbi:hypothetical protein QTP88_027985 [Uroleucon formosanum]